MNEGIQFIRDLMIILLAATAGGWGARRLGLSPVVGYLGAGLVIGAPQITVIYVTDPARIQSLSQVGLVLLMFAIGTGIRIRTIRKLGAGPVVATILSALLLLTLGRGVGSLLGLTRIESLFFAAMLMVSSSAIIGKILAERRLLHERVGQLALSQTLLEDFVAVVMLAVLGSAAAFDSGAPAGGGVLASLGKLAGFVLLVFLTGLVVLPRTLARFRERSGEEMHILLAAGLVFGFSFLSVLAGYSLALGAFLFGLLVAESAHNHAIARSFSGMRDIFAAIFFVSIGMGIDLTLMPEAVGLIVAGSLLALVGRAAAAAAGWLVACEPAPVALRAALHLTPIGEFSFIIAGFGIAAGVLPERFQIAAIGIAFITSILSPALMGNSAKLVALAGLDPSKPPNRWMQVYRGICQRLGQTGGKHILWKLLRKRFWQIGRELAWIAGMVVFAHPVYVELDNLAGNGGGVAWLVPLLPWFWLGVFLLLLVPVVSLVRNFEAVAMLVVDFYGSYSPAIRKFSRTWTILLQACGIAGLLLLLGNILPWWLFERWTLAALLAISLLVMLFGWKRLIRLHSEAEYRIQEAFEEESSPLAGSWQKTGQTWGLALEECVIPEDFSHTGKTVGELGLRRRTGATIIGIVRQDVPLGEPGPATHLFPGDTVYLIGRQADLAKARDLLSEAAPAGAGHAPDLEHAILESVLVPDGAGIVGSRLADLKWPRMHGVQVVAARVDGATQFSPAADWVVPAGCELLLAGNPRAILDIKGKLAVSRPGQG